MSKLEAHKTQFSKALNRLEEVMMLEVTEIVRDSAIQRFEFTIDLAWKYIKTILEETKGVICNSPKDCFREAFRQGLIEYNDIWIELVDLRNQTSHTYHEEVAKKVYTAIPEAIKYLKTIKIS